MNDRIPTPSLAALDIARTLIGFDTTSRRSNLGLIEWVRDELRRLGIATRLTYDAGGTKANLFATVGEQGQSGGIVLSGHTDVVPVDGQDWVTDPFKAEISNGRLFGRGSCDMKGFIACALAAAPQMLARNLARPLHLALSYDEEVGCIGVRGLLADLADQGIRPAACVVGEPTLMQLVIAHKGHRSMLCCLRGKEAHSSLTPHGLNAIEYGSRIIVQVQKMAELEETHGQRDGHFDVPYATLNCGTIRGGIAPNVVAKECDFSVELRYLPDGGGENLLDDLKAFAETQVLAQMRARYPLSTLRWTTLSDAPGLSMSPSSPLVQWLRSVSGTRSGLGRVAYSTEAGLFQRAGIPTVICGPGSIEQAHRPNEYVELSQLAECEDFLQTLTLHADACPSAV
jgi:acetylornithine deacetylase